MSHSPLFISPPKSLCILRLSAVGDVCHALAVVQHIQRYWPQTQLTWIVGKTEMGLLSGIEGVELIPYDKKSGVVFPSCLVSKNLLIFDRTYRNQ